MPSLAVHMAIAIEYMKKNDIKDKNAFMGGIKKPDYLGMISQKEKEKAHYTDKDAQNIKFSKKVNLFNYLSQNKINSDYEKGYYLHLLCDYLFFNSFFPYKKIEKGIPFQTLYDDYEKIAKLMEEKYDVNNKKTPWEGRYQKGEPTLFSKEEICDFVDVCSSLNLEKIQKIILSSKDDWREKVIKEYSSLKKH